MSRLVRPPNSTKVSSVRSVTARQDTPRSSHPRMSQIIAVILVIHWPRGVDSSGSVGKQNTTSPGFAYEAVINQLPAGPA